MTAAVLGPREGAVLAHLQEHPGLTARELARVFGLRNSMCQLMQRLERKALVVAVTALDPAQGRLASRWHPAPPGTVPPPLPPADPEGDRHRRERDRLSQRARRARARGLQVQPGMEAPSLKDSLAAAPDLPGAACVTADPDLFFPAEDERAADRRRRVAEALAVCAGCPARARCYRLAAARGERWGIWGGVDFDAAGKGRRAS